MAGQRRKKKNSFNELLVWNLGNHMGVHGTGGARGCKADAFPGASLLGRSYT